MGWQAAAGPLLRLDDDSHTDGQKHAHTRGPSFTVVIMLDTPSPSTADEMEIFEVYSKMADTGLQHWSFSISGFIPPMLILLRCSLFG